MGQISSRTSERSRPSRQHRRVTALAVAFALGLAACSSGGNETATETDRAEEALRKAEEALAAVEALADDLEGAPEALAFAEEGESEGGGEGEEEELWAYEGPRGPEAWGSASADFALCESGVEQSPINIDASSPSGTFNVGLDNVAMSWAPSDISVVDLGHTVQANVAPGNTTVLDGVTYDLLQFHFHKPSEHTVDGEAFPMELHFVHATPDGQLGVLGVLLAQGDANPGFAQILTNQTAVAPGATVTGFDLTSLLPADLGRWRYAGSLTTPPCSEGVNWNVLSTPITLSGDQISSFLYNGTARPTQPLVDRSVLSDAS